jgi:hypothetical protein
MKLFIAYSRCNPIYLNGKEWMQIVFEEEFIPSQY